VIVSSRLWAALATVLLVGCGAAAAQGVGARVETLPWAEIGGAAVVFLGGSAVVLGALQKWGGVGDFFIWWLVKDRVMVAITETLDTTSLVEDCSVDRQGLHERIDTLEGDTSGMKRIIEGDVATRTPALLDRIEALDAKLHADASLQATRHTELLSVLSEIRAANNRAGGP
jgi:hypothetical protein